MRRLILVVAAFALMMTAAASPAGADRPHALSGSWLAIDVEGSYWQVTFSANGRWNSIDSGTLPCEGYRTRLWGSIEEVAPNEFEATSFTIKCLDGPLTGTMIDFGPGWYLIYDADTDTILTPNPEPFRDVTFCRRPCDPYDYVP